jgi:sugar lactone lactonase YvrE
MKTATYGALVMLALMMGTATLKALPTVTTISATPPNTQPNYYGYVNTDTADSEFNTPSGIAYDALHNYLYVADKNNNAIRTIDLSGGLGTFTFAPYPPYVPASLISAPVGVAVDGSGNIFVLNYGNGNNGTILEFDTYGDLLATNATQLTNAAGITLDNADNIYVTVNSNQLMYITSSNITTIVTIPIAGTSLQGIVLKRAGPNAGLVAACDSGRDGIYFINPTNGVVTTNTGFNGQGDSVKVNNNGGTTKSQTKFFQPSGVAEAGDGSLIVTDYGNNEVKVVSTSGITTNLYGVPSSLWDTTDQDVFPGWWDGTVVVPFQVGYVESRLPFGVAIASDGSVYVSEDYYHVIRHITGAGLQAPLLPPTAPTGLSATVAFGQANLTWSASSGATSYNVERASTSGGPYTTIANTSGTSYTDTGLSNGTTYYYVVSAVGAGGVSGISAELIVTLPTLLPPTGLSATTNFNQVKLTWAASPGAASYNVKRSPSTGGETTIANVTATTYSDTTVVNGSTYYYVVSAVNAGGESANSLEISATVPIPPPPAPTIGWFDYEGNNLNGFFTVLHPVGITTFYNDQLIGISNNISGSLTPSIYISGPSPLTNSPSATNGSAAPYYKDGLSFAQPLSVTTVPDLIIKAVNVGAGGTSPVTTAEFLYQVGGPTITGNNGASFTISDITSNAVFYYTTDGSIPTNDGSGTAIGPITGTNNPPTAAISLNLTSNTTFTVRAFRNGYAPSSPNIQIFSTNPAVFVQNTISFGFTSGEASSAFIAAPGQTFVAPVTLTMLPSTTIYSLQFNLVVTNAGSNPGPAPAPGGYYTYNVPFVVPFQSMLMQPDPTNSDLFVPIPPAMFVSGVGLESLLNINNSENLVGVGWLERYSETNLYNTKSQTLITYSLPHDDLFPNPQQPNGVVVGGYSFTVPTNATPGQTYQIRIGLPSATSDGVGAPGHDVFIYAPTNGSMGAGSLNAIKNVTIGSAQYIAGDSAPFRWFNAGDFGDTNLDNADVEQVFQSAMYALNYPPLGSDFFDSMDSAGDIGVDSGFGYMTNAGPVASEAAYGNNDDTSVNFSVFGDGTLDVSDVYTTFRRSLDSSLMLYSRFRTNDTVNNYSGLVAVTFARSNIVSHQSLAKSLALPASGPLSITNLPSVNFASTDFVASAGQVLQIPVTAKVFGQYPLRVAMLNISVVPLDGSPPLTVPISFTPNGTNTALGTPTSGFTASDGNGNYGAAWLDSTIGGISNSAVIGTLTVTIPTNATSLSSYAIHFDHASGSPNGWASFSRHAFTGLITLSSRTNSTYNDGIPDSWRLRWFGTVNNLLSVSNADADAAGFNNWYKYVAGLDPTDPKSKLAAGTDQPMSQSPQDSVIYWPSMTGKQYVIQRSSSLFPGTWNSISTNTGTGGNMEIHDASGGNSRFYRVSVH